MKKKIKIGVIPAAGSGKRLGYLSSLLPKTLFPLHDRPIIHYVVNQMEFLGIEEVYIIVNVYKEKIIEYFKFIEMDLRIKLHFIEQKRLDGTANAILLAEKYIKKQPFMVIYGDDCTVTNSLKPMVDLFFKTKAVVVEGVVKEKDKKILRQTCSVKLKKDGKMIEILEKPEKPPYMYRGCGVYLFRPEIFDFIKNTPIHLIRKEREITYTINSVAEADKAYGFIIDGYNININDYNELLKAGLLVKESSRRKNNKLNI
jgi:dTDP-glucose pyrophosphorylase